MRSIAGKTNFKGDFGMHKKLMAVAVAGALAAPLAAQAQSTVQIYGVAEWEYGQLEQGSGRPRVDYNEVTGSYLGFKGEEALGGGLSAWFQCETTMDIRAFDQVGLCSRNSGLGMKGAFGNVWGGRWHTPFSRIFGIGSVGVEETGNLGFSNIHGGSGSQSAVEQGSGDAGSLGRQRFRRRESCLTTYETPNLSGFQVGAAVSCGNAASTDGPLTTVTTVAGGGMTSTTTVVTSGANNTKPRVYSIAGTYNQGPLGLGLGYQKHDDFGAFNTVGARELTDRAWGASARYTFGPVLLGMTYMDRKWEQPDGDLKNRTWTIGGVWTIAGPHQLHFAYGDTGDSKGNSRTRIGGQGGAEAPQSAAGAVSDTGYSMYSLGYQYSLSKRTSVKFGWTHTSNDTNSRANYNYNTQSLSAAMIGQDQDSYSIIVKHRF